MDSDIAKFEKIRLLRKGEFKGSLYFEFAPGGFSANHWQENSVYLSEDVFHLLEPIFVKVIPGFAHYSFNEISRSNWELINNELKTLRAALVKASALSDVRERMWFSEEFETLFFEHFDKARRGVLKLITDLNAWLDAQLKTHEKVSVLGI